jgi:tagatose-1,6-bisphosphate aldolase
VIPARGLAGISDASGRLRVLAIDHRDSLSAFLAPHDPSSVPAATMTALKIELVAALAPLATGVMLEPELSIPQVIDAGVLPAGVGFIAALEDQGYLADPAAAVTRILPGWSVAAALASGASAVKLLLPYQPRSPLAGAQIDVARAAVAEAAAHDIPLVLEPLLYGIDEADAHAAGVVETVRRFAPLGAALLKLPFPGAGRADATVARRSCEQITELCVSPWALLSGGGTFEAFAAQLAVACAAGCAGFMVGRALWGEAVRADAATRPTLLRELVAPRLVQLGEIVDDRH